MLVEGIEQGHMGPPVDDAFEIEWFNARLMAALDIVANEADPLVFQSFQLCALHQRSPRDAARLLGITRNAVYINKGRILKRLQAVIRRMEAEDD